MSSYKNFRINGVLVGAYKYNEKGYYEFYDYNLRIIATISSDELRLPKDRYKAFNKLANLFGDSEDK